MPIRRGGALGGFREEEPKSCLQDKEVVLLSGVESWPLVLEDSLSLALSMSVSWCPPLQYNPVLAQIPERDIPGGLLEKAWMERISTH